MFYLKKALVLNIDVIINQMEKEKPEGWARVDSSTRRILGDYRSLGIEVAFNADVPVIMPPLEGLSPKAKSTAINLEQSVANILASPTQEELERWAGMSEQEIHQDVENYVRQSARDQGVELIEASNKDS